MHQYHSKLWRLLFLVVSLSIPIGGSARAVEPAANGQLPHWIWGKTSRTDWKSVPQAVRLEKSFNAAGAIETATLRVAADFCRATVELNGRAVLRLEPYSPTTEMDVTAYLAGGENRLAIAADHVCGPNAVALSL